MENIYEFLLSCVNNKKIDRETAIEAIKLVKQEEAVQKTNGDIAIIGMSGRLPSAANLDEFWENIKNGQDCISKFPESRRRDITDYLKYMGMADKDIKYCRSAYLDEIDKFDYKFFKLSPKEASIIDPAQRIFLEVAWQVLEDAGYGGKRLSGSSTGVYVGFSGNVKDLYASLVSDVEPSALAISMVGNLTSVIPSRISYLLDLKGPGMVIDTACSSSLVSVDLACQAIKNGYCEYAIAGGINIDTVPIDKEYTQIGIESSDGRSRTFDEYADGSGIGEGVAAVLLKPLEKALKDNDHIYAVIKGSAVNQDGNSAGLTAPNPASQADVIVKAWEKAGIHPETIAYIETHGTGTNLGDPIEIKGIQNAFRKYTDKRQFCAVSSVKTSIGHLCEASGLVSMIKAVLALRNMKIPPSGYFNRPNKAIDFIGSPVYINTRTMDWAINGYPRRCSVSSFGISGTNCHLVLEEAVPSKNNQNPPYDLTRVNILTLSAADEGVLKKLINDYRIFLANNPEIDLLSLCYTANTGRGDYAFRAAITAREIDELRGKLDYLASGLSEGDGVYYGEHRVLTNKSKQKSKSTISKEEKNKLNKQICEKIDQYIETGMCDDSVPGEICKLYTLGADVKWELLYKGINPPKVPLPVYPFKRSRCWIDIPQYPGEGEDNTPGSLFHRAVWQEESVKNSAKKLRGSVIVLMDSSDSDDHINNEIISELNEEYEDVITVITGEKFEKNDNNLYTIRNTEEDYNRLFSILADKNISHILHLLSVSRQKEITGLEELKENQEKGVYSLFYIVRSLVNNGLEKNINIFIVSRYVNNVTGNEKRINPENATLIGLGKVIGLELPDLHCRCMDIDDSVNAADILLEMKLSTSMYQAAYRDSKRYIEGYDEYDIDKADSKKLIIKKNGVYIISGGMGGIGIEIAKYLSTKANIILVLIGRTGLPPREEWDNVLECGGEKQVKCIKYIREIESEGSQVLCYSTNICDFDKTKQIINEVRQKSGRIDGVFNCAGVAGGSFLIRREKEKFDEVLGPKVYGTWNLDHLTRRDNLDFFIMFSSGLAILSEPGNGDYTAANCYLGAYSAYRQKKGMEALAIDWVSWKDAGMSVEHGFNKDTIFKALSTEQAVKALNTIMNKDIERVLIGEFNNDPEFYYMLDWATFRLSPAIESYIENRKKGGEDELSPGVFNRNIVALTGRESSGFTETEKKVARIYNEVLGLEEINIYDSFFELGGDSVMLSRMYTLLDQEFPGRIKLIDVFSNTSIAAMSEFLSGSNEETSKEDLEVNNIIDIFDELDKGKINIDDALKNIYEP